MINTARRSAAHPQQARRLASLSIGLLPAAILIWTLGMVLSRLELNGFGLISGLHPLWFVGVGLGVMGMILAVGTKRHSTLLGAYAIAILLMVTGTAVLLERAPRFPYIFNSYSFGDQILRTGQIDYSQVYVSWPGWHVVTAVAIGASRIDPATLLTWLPVWLSIMALSGLMALVRRFRLPRRQRWLALGLAVTTFLTPVYPLPGPVALIMLTFLVAILLEEHLGTRRSVRRRAGVIVLFAALVPMHLLTSVAAVVIVLASSAFTVVAYRRRSGSGALVGLAILTAYLIYVTVEVTAQLLPQQIAILLELERLFSSILGITATAIGGGSPEHLQVVRIRIGYVVAIAVLAVLGMLVAIIARQKPRRWSMPTAWVAGGVASLGVGAYGGEILARASAIAAPGSLALASWIARFRGGIGVLAAVMLVGAVISPINLFGNELFDYVRPSELAADAVLRSRPPSTWRMERPSRTWYGEEGAAATGPFVTVYGPVYRQAYAQISAVEPPAMPHWSYTNGELRIMITRDRLP